MARTIERQNLDVATQLFLLNQDADDMEKAQYALEKKLNSIFNLLLTVLVTLVASTLAIAGTILSTR